MIEQSYPVLRESRRRYADYESYGEFCRRVAAAGPVPDVEAEPVLMDGTPWLTPVLGSGCLDLPAAPGFDAASLANGVVAELEVLFAADGPGAVSDDDMREDLQQMAADFTRSLVRDRVDPPRRGGPAPELADLASNVAAPTEVDALAARLTLVAALLTRFFHMTRAYGPSAMSRWGGDEARFAPKATNHEAVRTLLVDVLDPLKQQLVAVRLELEAAGREPMEHAVSAYLKTVEDRVAPDHKADAVRSLDADDLRLVTEVAWFFLTRRTPVYPGWTDLLLQLALRQPDEDNQLRSSRRPRPKYRFLPHLAEGVATLMEPATKASWDLLDPNAQHVSQRDRLYGATAYALWAQCEARQRAAESSARRWLPPVAAFVTSFDIELEMALWVQAAADRRPFSVVVPVHVLGHPDAADAEPCWLVGTVEPMEDDDKDEALKALRTPVWRVLPSAPPDDDEIYAGPVVVHLSGSPLFKLPDLDNRRQGGPELAAGLRSLGIPVGPRTVLTHAVTVDEYLALRQSAAELFWSGTSEKDSDSRNRVLSRVLPLNLTRSPSRNVRFWMSIGVPIADPAVRHRLISQMTVQLMRSAGEPGAGEVEDEGHDDPSGLGSRPPSSGSSTTVEYVSDMRGLAVNRRIDDDEASVLYWLGLDVVEDDCVHFIPDLIHYGDHVKKNVHMSSQGGCPLNRSTR